MYRQVSESRVFLSMLVTLNSNLVVFQDWICPLFFSFVRQKKQKWVGQVAVFSVVDKSLKYKSRRPPSLLPQSRKQNGTHGEQNQKYCLEHKVLSDKSHIITKSRLNSFFLIHRSWAPIKRFTVSESKAAKSVALWRLNEFMSNRFMLLWELNFKTKPDFSKMH